MKSERHSDESPEDFPCPVCGAMVKAGRLSCRACGASDSDGWSDEPEEGWAEAEEDEDEVYESYVEREFGIRQEGKGSRGGCAGAVLMMLLASAAVTLLM